MEVCGLGDEAGERERSRGCEVEVGKKQGRVVREKPQRNPTVARVFTNATGIFLLLSFER